MEISEAVDLIAEGVTDTGGIWADLGAGSGTFTEALASLVGGAGSVYAIDTNGDALPAPGVSRVLPDGANVVPLIADFREPLPLTDLDGVLMANSLHFIERGAQERVLARIVEYLRDGGAFLLVEYDQRGGSPWVPFPLPPRRFMELAPAVGLSQPREIARRRSRYGPRDIYAAVAFRAPFEAARRVDRT